MVGLTTQCIEPYDPDLRVNVDLLTVDASIIRGHDEQTVIITRSTPVDDTEYRAVENCNVFVTDDRGNNFQFEERSAGLYLSRIDDSYLNIGAKFKLSITTPDNNIYESDFEEIQDCPSVDSLYFVEETNYFEELNRDINGLRLYLDLPVLPGYTGYYRWKINETWEYSSRNSRIYAELVGVKSERNSDTTEVAVPVFNHFKKQDSLHYCWNNEDIYELYSTSTVDLITNGMKQVPLNFVPGNDDRLRVRYSCLLGQYSLSEGAYNYWHSKKIELQESGGIYFTQPNQTASNIRNINNEQEKVLGYFWTSTVKQKRIFFDGPFIPGDGISPCYADTFDFSSYYKQDITELGGFVLTNPGDLPVYIERRIERLLDSITLKFYWDTIYLTTDKSCYDCRLQGGTINRPEYW